VTANRSRSPSRREYTVTLHVTVEADADLVNPFIRAEFFRALAEQLHTRPLPLHTPDGAGVALIGLVMATS
jgi:hypothetical protein